MRIVFKWLIVFILVCSGILNCLPYQLSGSNNNSIDWLHFGSMNNEQIFNVQLFCSHVYIILSASGKWLWYGFQIYIQINLNWNQGLKLVVFFLCYENMIASKWTPQNFQKFSKYITSNVQGIMRKVSWWR